MNKWVVTRSYNFTADCTAVSFDKEYDAVQYMKKWYKRDIESDHKAEASMDEDDRRLRENECTLGDYYACIVWRDDEYSEAERCEYNVIMESAPDPELIETADQEKEDPEDVTLRVFLWDGLVDDVKSSDPNQKINIEIFNCDPEHDDREKYNKEYCSGLESVPFSLLSNTCEYD